MTNIKLTSINTTDLDVTANLENALINNNKTEELIYIIDFLNIFSDYREVKYAKNNIDFHTVKHFNKEKDTKEFFDLFFTKFIKYSNINIQSNFIFVLKKISHYDIILQEILLKYKHLNIRFIIIENKFNESILDKNKDDFLCQYIMCFLICKNSNSILISNDKYRDRLNYINKYKYKYIIDIKVLKLNSKNQKISITIIDKICEMIKTEKFKRNTIAKTQLKNII
jgi:hypothetical protein